MTERVVRWRVHGYASISRDFHRVMLYGPQLTNHAILVPEGQESRDGLAEELTMLCRIVEAAIQDVRAGQSRDNLDASLSFGLSHAFAALAESPEDRDEE